MNLSRLERRNDTRTPAFVPIQLEYEHTPEIMQAHLLDLSHAGAGIVTAAYNAPSVGDHITLRHDTHNTDGGTESAPGGQTGIVMNVARPEEGITRIGVRFLERRGADSDETAPRDLIGTSRSAPADGLVCDRWTTARHFGINRSAAEFAGI